MITREQVEHIARLAKLELDETELERMTRELDRILGYMELLNELDASTAEPTAQVQVEPTELREDVAQHGLDREQVLEQSPSSSHGGFAVPAFVDE